MASLGVERFTELVSTTLESIREDLQDQVLLRHPTLDLFRENAGSDEGRTFVMNLEADELDGTDWTDASGTFSTDVDNDIITAAEYEWTMPLISKTRLRHRDIEMNSGSKTQVVNRVKTHIEAAKKGHAKKLAQALHASVPASGSIDSFPVLVAPDGEVGGIDPDSDPSRDYWRSPELVMGRDEYPNILKVFRTAENDLEVSTSSQHELTHIVAGRNIFEEYVDHLDEKVRYVNLDGASADKDAQTKFRAVYFGNVEMRLDPDCEADTAYFLDIGTWAFKYLNDNWMKMHDAQQIVGTLDFVTPIASICGIGTSERRANLVLKRPDVQPA